MKKVVLLLHIIGLILLLACSCSNKESLSREELHRLKETYPYFSNLDVAEGLNVLVYGYGKEKEGNPWRVIFVPGSKDHYALTENIRMAKYGDMTLEDAKKLLIYYGLPDDQVTLHPYEWPFNEWRSLSSLLEEEDYLPRMAEAFDNRYKVGEVWPVRYDPEIDKLD